ncbi:hypothetical protein FisN_4Hh070 [Fistulifera solaris]|uniref:Nudix hydrolase domain-containing protein n=1 Tax=Fistulifera solaris TaxID=1519565 RepID=A0A1Z5KEP9_FISSO|nr:hypothetical protein FisN_4Hh070 [Fistulifera solaris]|eukprot:GAX24551.1 hypothetical protein FisN_4Hh070 [Fistulifera solaris]
MFDSTSVLLSPFRLASRWQSANKTDVAPSPTSIESPVVIPGTDYRAFLIAVHEKHGMLLLHCTRKKNKGPHWQLPGGHVDDFEFKEAANETRDSTEQLLIAAKKGAVRELFEETGLDLRSQLHRVNPLRLADRTNMHKNRLFFVATVQDTDFNGKIKPIDVIDADHLKLDLSEEHSGFTFQKDPLVAADMLQQHSGGKPSEAVRMALQNEDAACLMVTKPAEVSPRRTKYTKERILAIPEAFEIPPPKANKNMFSLCCPGKE